MNKNKKHVKKQDEPKIKKNIVSALNLPQDVALGSSLITITGKNEIFIENYKGILDYDSNYIKLNTKKGVIELLGRNLFIKYLTNEEMKITGKISEIKFK